MKFVSLLVLVASLSQSSASAQVLIAPTKDRFAVSLRDLNATTPSLASNLVVNVDGSGPLGGAFDELLAYLTHAQGYAQSTDIRGAVEHRACGLIVRAEPASSIIPAFLVFRAADFNPLHVGQVVWNGWAYFTLQGPPAQCLTEAMKAAGSAAGVIDLGRLQRGAQIVCGKETRFFHSDEVSCRFTMKD